MLVSRLTQKGQATIPAEIRALLKLHSGDEVAFEIEEGKVVIRKAAPLDVHYAKALNITLAEEWGSEGDNEAYNDL